MAAILSIIMIWLSAVYIVKPSKNGKYEIYAHYFYTEPEVYIETCNNLEDALKKARELNIANGYYYMIEEDYLNG